MRFWTWIFLHYCREFGGQANFSLYPKVFLFRNQLSFTGVFRSSHWACGILGKEDIILIRKREIKLGTANQRIPSLILQGHSSDKKRGIQNLFPQNSRFRVSIWHQHLINSDSWLLNSIITGTFLILLKNTFLPYYLDVRNWFLEIFGVWACFWWHGL